MSEIVDDCAECFTQLADCAECVIQRNQQRTRRYRDGPLSEGRATSKCSQLHGAKYSWELIVLPVRINRAVETA